MNLHIGQFIYHQLTLNKLNRNNNYLEYSEHIQMQKIQKTFLDKSLH